jgi:hypothetical protein
MTLLAGLAGGWWLAYRTGKAVARAQRAWRDYRATIASIKGLFRQSVSMHVKALKHVLVGLGVLAGVVVALVVAVTR